MPRKKLFIIIIIIICRSSEKMWNKCVHGQSPGGVLQNMLPSHKNQSTDLQGNTGLGKTLLNYAVKPSTKKSAFCVFPTIFPMIFL